MTRKLLLPLRSLRFEPLEPRSLLSAVPLGGEFRINTYTTNNQVSPSIAADANGNFVVAWQSNQDGSSGGIYAQRYNAAGAAQGAEFLVNTVTTFDQSQPAVAMDADGDFVVVWTSPHDGGSGTFGTYGVYARRYNSAGVPQGTEFLVNTYTTSNQNSPSVDMDADGDFVIAWGSLGQDGSGVGVYAQRYNSAGATQGAEFRVNTFTTNYQAEPSVAMDADGDFVVVWTNSGADGNTFDVYAQRYDAAGVPEGGEFRVNTYTTGEQRFSSVAIAPAGDFVVVWQSFGQDSSGWDIFAQRYNAAGVPQGTEFRVNSYPDGGGLSIAMDAEGDFAIVWTLPFLDGSDSGVYAQHYDAAGVAQGKQFRVHTYTANQQSASSVAMDQDGNFVVAWSSFGQDGGGLGIYAQRYQPGLYFDFDDDGDEDAADIDILWRIVRGTGADPNENDDADLNTSGLVNEDDLDFMIGVLYRTYADADLDYDVDAADFDAWRLRDSAGGGIGWATGDFDGDNDVDGADFDLWRTRPREYPESVTLQSAASLLSLGEGQGEGAAAPLSLDGRGAGGEGADAKPQIPSSKTQTTSKPEPPNSRLPQASSLEPQASSPMYRSRHARRLPPVSPTLADKLFAAVS